MGISRDIRPDPETLLRTIKRAEEKDKKGKLKIFFGMCAGAGKTYEMLLSAQEESKKGVDVVIGYVETHGRKETAVLSEGLTLIPRKKTDYRGTIIEEMDIDAILERKPSLVLVDELAHTNAPGSRHTKRYLDVLEILNNGINVYTTLNVQHLESRSDTVAQITGSIVRETVPDSVFEQADEVEVIDLSPDELLKRLAEGKVYAPERSQRAVQNFFRKGNLTALREMCLRIAAERIDHQLRDYMQVEQIPGPWKSGQRLIIGISPSPTSVHLIRWARRTAFTMKASWVAVYVEKSKPLNDTAKDQLIKNINLARELGAEIITTADDDIALALLRVAKEQNATQILIGKSEKLFHLKKTVLQEIIEKSGNLDIYIIGGEEDKDLKQKRWYLPDFSQALSQFSLAAAIVILTALICYPISDVIGYQTVSLILLLMVALLPLRLGVGPVLLAATLSALIWDFFFIPPRFTFAVSSPQDILMLIAYFIIAAVAGVLTVRIRAREKAVRQREQRASALYALTNDLSIANNQENVVSAAIHNIKKFFNAEVVAFLSDIDGDFTNKPHSASSFFPDNKELSVPTWVHWNEKKAGRFTETLPFASATYFPLKGPRYPLGVIGIKIHKDERLSTDQETLLENFLSQISSALDREFLNEMAKQSIALAESERLYSTLFHSISHEIRTPITAIFTASESLLNENISGQPAIRNQLTKEIQSATSRLDQIVQNLLAMTRLESGFLLPKLDWCEIRDIINSSIDKLKTELEGHSVKLNIQSPMPLVKLDFGLIEQVLINLLRNSATHTQHDSSIHIDVFTEEQNCVITLSDNGPGFPKEVLGKVFQKFYRVPGSKTGGLGLGLSIALGFVQAHHGTLTVENLPDGGVKFTARLPIGHNMNISTDLQNE
jgi:two-component system, OmpR family, sensor histidine kinase KdpD